LFSAVSCAALSPDSCVAVSLDLKLGAGVGLVAVPIAALAAINENPLAVAPATAPAIRAAATTDPKINARALFMGGSSVANLKTSLE
jgi:hypothetical protein